MNIQDEITIPGQEARHGEVPAWLADSPVWPAVKAQTGGGRIFLHQATGLELLGQGHNLVISTGTASGKSLVFQAPTLHHLATPRMPRPSPSTRSRPWPGTRSSGGGTWRRPPVWTPPPSTASTATCAT